jgi:protein transport protein SEC13
MRFVTGGCDNKVKIWEISEDEPDNLQMSIKSFKNTKTLTEHKDWVRDVAWLNYVGYAYDTIASCSEDEHVYIYKYEDKEWKSYPLNKKFGVPTWKVSWSHCGSYLACSAGDNCVYLFKESTEGKWEEITQINQDGNAEALQN